MNNRIQEQNILMLRAGDSLTHCALVDDWRAHPADWPDQIRRAWAEGGVNTLTLAKLVRQARRELQRGEWSRLWEPGKLPFSRRKAQMLLVIANGLDWINVQTFAQMPPGWSILYLLAQLQRSQLEGLIAEGLVHSRLKLREAKELVARFRPGNGQRAAKGPNVTQRFENFEEFIAATLEDWSPEQRDWAHGKLEAITFLVESNPDSFHLPLPSRRARADIFPSQQAEPAVNFKSRIFPERIL